MATGNKPSTDADKDAVGEQPLQKAEDDAVENNDTTDLLGSGDSR